MQPESEIVSKFGPGIRYSVGNCGKNRGDDEESDSLVRDEINVSERGDCLNPF